MSQRLFRVYFSTEPHVPAHSYRHIWANDLEHAKDQVNKELAPHRQALDDVGFYLGAIREEPISLLGDYLQAL